jgi:hypothetical protein
MYVQSNKQKNVFFKLVFVGVLKANDENSSIRIRTKMSWIRNIARQVPNLFQSETGGGGGGGGKMTQTKP